MAIQYDEKEFDIHKTVLIEYLGDKKEVIVPEGKDVIEIKKVY